MSTKGTPGTEYHPPNYVEMTHICAACKNQGDACDAACKNGTCQLHPDRHP